MAAIFAVAALVGLVWTPDSGRASGCTITWVGDVNNEWFGGSAPADTNWSDDTFPDASDHACLNNTGTPYTVTLGQTTVSHYSIESEATLALGGGFFRATADSTNAGTIRLNGADAEIRTEDGTAATTETLTNLSTGTISIPAGAAGLRSISGDLLNQGTISVAHPEADFQPRSETRKPKLTNTGTINVASGGALETINATLRQQGGGTINGPGPVNLRDPSSFSNVSTLEIAGGQIAAGADVNLVCCGPNEVSFVAGSASATGNIDVQFGNHPINGNVPAGFSIDVESGGILRAQADYTNAGTITLNGAEAEIRTENGDNTNAETLTNTGTIAYTGTGGTQFIGGDLLNQGTITVAHPVAQFTQRSEVRKPKLTNTGTLTVASGGDFEPRGAILRQESGGTINGPGSVNVHDPFSFTVNSVLEIAGGTIDPGADVNLVCCGFNEVSFVAGSAGATGNVDVESGERRISGNVPAGFSIDVQSGGILRSLTDYTNAGTITLTAAGAEIRTENGDNASIETLTNTGTIAYLGTAGSQHISGDLANQGTLSVAHPDAGFQPRSENRPPKLMNSGSGSITFAPTSQLTVHGGVPVELQGGSLSGSGRLVATLQNSGGDVRPGGNGVGTLDVQGTYTQTSGGKLSVDVATSGGVTSSDRLAVTGAASVAGALEIDTDGGFPELDTRLQILTASSRTGTFDAVAGLLGGPYEVDYLPNGIDLVAVANEDVPSLEIADASVVEGDAGSTDLVFEVTISPPPDPATQVEVDYETSDDTAEAGSDYTAAAGTLTFAPGDLSEEIHVPVSGDTAAEPDETLQVRLRNAIAAPMRDMRALGTILGDDTALEGVTPNRGGTPGSATITVTGTGFGPASTLELSRGGDEILGSDPVASATGTELTATFDLTGAEQGAWDVTATGNFGDTVTSPGAFTVEPLRPGRVVASATIPPQLRTGFVGRFVVTLRNTGNTDAELDAVRILGTDVEMRRRGADAFVEGILDIGADEPGDAPGPPIGILAPDTARTLTIEFRSTTDVAHAGLRLRAEIFTRDGLEAALERSVEPGSEEEATFPPPPGRIDGVVEDSNGQPLPGVPVTGEPSSGFERVVITGENGQFAFTGLEDGDYTVSLGGGLGAVEDRRSVVIAPADRTVDLVFATGISEVSGSVRAVGGSRLGAATVHLRRDGELIDVADADGGGAFRFLVIDPGTYDLVAFHEELGVARLNGVIVTAGSAIGGLRIEASTGQLTVNTNPAAVVAARPVDLQREQSLHLIANGGGQAPFTNLAPGEYEVKTTLAGRAPRRDTVTIGGGTTTLSAPLAPGAAVEGTVSGDGGAPVPDATVWAIDAASGITVSDRTDAGGNYRIDTLTPGAVDLWFSAPGYAPVRISGPVAPEGGTVDVDAALVSEGRDIEFTAVSGTPDRTIIGAAITVFDPTEQVPLAYALTTKGGTAQLGPLTPGTYRVEATAPGLSPLRRDLVVPVADGRRGLIETVVVGDGPTLEEALAMPIPSSLHFPTHDTFEGLALEGKLGRDWYSTIPPPQRQGPDAEPTWRPSYADVDYDQPCPNANHLYSLLTHTSRDVQRTFANLLVAHQALGQVNGALVQDYLRQSAEIGVQIWTLGRQLKFLSKLGPPANNLNGVVEFGIAGAADLGTNLVQNYRSGEGVGLTAEQGVTSTLGQIAAVLDQQIEIAKGTPLAGPIVSTALLVKKILDLQKDLDESYDRDFLSVVRGFEQAEDQYHAAVRKHAHLMRLFNEEAAKCPDDGDENPKPEPDVTTEATSDNVAPNDPNDIEGPLGVGPERWIKPDGDLGYTVRFENIGPGTVNPPPGSTPATAPAVLVTVEQTLAPAVDLDTFALGSLGWGDIEVDVPGGLQSFHGEVLLDDGDSVYVDASLDRSTRKVSWRLETIDPETGELQDDPEGGFLPPEPGGADAGAGMGRVTYTARLLDSVAHGATVPAQARIVFDLNPPIDTPTWTNTVDRTEPTSAVSTVSQPGTSNGGGGCLQQLEVSWAGSDTGSGLDSFTVMVSQNGGPFELWLSGTTATSGTLLTEPGSRYDFISVARDRVGNEEAPPTEPDQGVRTFGCDETAPTVTGAIEGGDDWRRTNADVTLSGFDGFGGAGVKEISYQLSGAQTGGATVQEAFTSFTVSSEGVTTVTYGGTDFADNVATQRTLAVRIDRTAPGINIQAPADGSTVPQGSTVNAAYSCSDPLSGVQACTGTVASGVALPASTLGQKTFTVTARDVAGNERTVTRSYTVVSPVDFGSNLNVTVSLGKMKKAKTAPVEVRNGYDFPITGQLRLLAATKKANAKPQPITAFKPLSIQGGATQELKLKIKGAAKRALSAGKKVKVVALAEVENSAGQERTLEQKLKLKVSKG